MFKQICVLDLDVILQVFPPLKTLCNTLYSVGKTVTLRFRIFPNIIDKRLLCRNQIYFIYLTCISFFFRCGNYAAIDA